MFNLRARIACRVIALGYRMLPQNIRTRTFVYNAMLTGHINAPERRTHNGGESDG